MFLSNEGKRLLVLKGNLYKGLILLSLPIIFNNLMQTLYGLVDTYWVGKISENSDVEVAAVGAVWPITFLVIGFGMGLHIAGTSLMSQNIGAGNKKRANFIAGQLFTFSIITGIILMVVGLFLSPFIIRLMGIEGEGFLLGKSYLGILFFEIPFIFSLFIFTSMRQAYGDTITPVIFTVISVVLNIILDPFFIVDHIELFGVTIQGLDLGVKGAAYATVLSKIVIVPFWLYMAFFDKKGIHLEPKNLLLKVKPLKKIIDVALPAALGQALTAVGFIFLNYFIYEYGEQTMAAFSVSNRINSLVMMPAMGVGSALSFYIGQNIGNQNYVRAKQAFKAAMIITLSTMGVGMLVMLPRPVRELIVGQFLDTEETIKMAMAYMLFVGFNTPLMGIFQNLMGVFQGAGKTIYVFIITVARLWLIRLPVIALFQSDVFTNHIADFGSNGIWYAMLLSNIIVCVAGFYLYFRGNWQRRIIDAPDEEDLVVNPLTHNPKALSK